MSESKVIMEDLLAKSIQVLEHEVSEYRPLDQNGIPGGLILLQQDLPTIIIPDLHGRKEYLPDLMHFRYKNERI